MTFIEILTEMGQYAAGVVIGFSIVAANKVVGGKYKLSKDPKLPKAVSIKKVTLPGELKKIRPRVKQELSDYNEKIDFFVKTLEKNYPKEYLKNLYHNLSYLTVRKKKLKDARGLYKPFSNTIDIGIEEEVRTIYHELFHIPSAIETESGILYHELFHMSSTIDSKHIGFFNRSIGDELNEGFTDVLSKRNFNNYTVGYPYYYSIASILEKIVGPNMTKCYFEANLLGLIEELKKYISEEEIMQFLTNLSKIGDLTQDNRFNVNDYNKKTVVMLIGKISKFILEIYDSYLKKELQEGRINNEEYINELRELIMGYGVMSAAVRINGRYYANPLTTIDEKNRKTVLTSEYEDVSEYQSMGL